jgi:hypothetical protein
LINIDFSVFKNNYIETNSGSLNIRFWAEFFSIVNHANFQVHAGSRDRVAIFITPIMLTVSSQWMGWGSGTSSVLGRTNPLVASCARRADLQAWNYPGWLPQTRGKPTCSNRRLVFAFLSILPYHELVS